MWGSLSFWFCQYHLFHLTLLCWIVGCERRGGYPLRCVVTWWRRGSACCMTYSTHWCNQQMSFPGASTKRQCGRLRAAVTGCCSQIGSLRDWTAVHPIARWWWIANFRPWLLVSEWRFLHQMGCPFLRDTKCIESVKGHSFGLSCKNMTNTVSQAPSFADFVWVIHVAFCARVG